MSSLTVCNPSGGKGTGAYSGGKRSSLRAGWNELCNIDTGGLLPFANAVPTARREQRQRVEQLRVQEPQEVLNDVEKGAVATASARYTHGYLINSAKGCRRAALFQQNADLGVEFFFGLCARLAEMSRITHTTTPISVGACLIWQMPSSTGAADPRPVTEVL